MSAELYEKAGALEKCVEEAEHAGDVLAEAKAFREKVLPQMEAAREVADTMETLIARKYWPFPTYGELLYGVK